ncbi:hypothetical protein QYM36_011739 [Artemia franciscana]|uniref:Uncharacterized protein n=1 Tax=Artemia franciscana TaxID=6661 RepID=A0AA88HPA4_ARTSF|nr:hypothetical protein QYM36_011739 [Artemia franciscana]
MDQYSPFQGFRFMQSERPGSSQQRATASHREIPINPDQLVPPPPPSLSATGRQKAPYRADTDDFYRNRSKEMVVPVQRNSYQREEGLYQREERINIGQREERINEDRIMQEIFLLKKEMSRVSVELLAVKQQNESQEVVNSLRKDVSTLQGEMQMLIAGMSEISGKEDRFERTLEKYSEKHDQLKNEIRFLDKEFKSLKENQKGLGKDFKALWVDTKSMTAVHGDLIGLEKKFESHKAMEARMVSKFETMSKLKADLDLASRDIYSLRESLNKKFEAFHELEKRMTKLSAVDHRIKRSTSPESFSLRLKKVEEAFSKKIARIESYFDESNRRREKTLINDSNNFSKESMGAQEELPERTDDVPTERIVKLLDRKANEPVAAKPETVVKIVNNKANETTSKEPEKAVKMVKNNGNLPAGGDTGNIVKTVKRKANELAVEEVEKKRQKKQDQGQIQVEHNLAAVTNNKPCSWTSLDKPYQLTRVFKYKLLSDTKMQIFGKIGLCRKTLILPVGKVYYKKWLSFPMETIGDIHCMLHSCKKGDEVIETVLFGWIDKKPQMVSSNSIVYAKTSFHSLGFELVNDKIAKVNFIIDKQPVWLELKVEMLSIGMKACSNLSSIPTLAFKRVKYVLDLDEHHKPHIIKATLGEQVFKEQSLCPVVSEIENSQSGLELERTSNSLATEVTDNLNPNEMIVLDAIYESETSQKDDSTSIEDEVNLKDNLPVAPESISPIKDSVLKNAKQTEAREQEPFKAGNLKTSIKWRPKSLDKSGDVFHSYVGAPQKYEDPADMEYVPHEKAAVESHLPTPSTDEMSPKLMSQSAITSGDIEIIDENIPLKNPSSLKSFLDQEGSGITIIPNTNITSDDIEIINENTPLKNLLSTENSPDHEPSKISIIQEDSASEKSLSDSAQESCGDKVLHPTLSETTEKQRYST